MVALRDPRELNDGFTVPLEAVAHERFERATYDPTYARALQHAPSAPPDSGDAIGWVALLFGVFLLSIPFILDRGGLLLSITMAVFGLLLLLLGVVTMSSAREYRRAPIERQVVVMLGHYVHKHQGAKGIVYRHNRMLLAFRTHEVLDVSCSEELVRRMRPGDLGMAFLKLAVLVDFIPLRDDCQPTATATPSSSLGTSAP